MSRREGRPGAPREGRSGASPQQDGETFDDVVAELGGAPRLAERDALQLLAAALQHAGDPKLLARYERLLLDRAAVDTVRPMVAGLACPSAQQIVDAARDRFDTNHPDARQLIAAVTHRPAERVRRALWLLAVPPRTVAFEAADADALAREGDNPISTSTSTFTVLNALVSVATSAFIVRYAIQHHDWWPVALIWPVWLGHPIVTLLIAAVLWPATDAITTLSALALAVLDLAMVRTEQRNALIRTGMRMTIGQWRTHVRLGRRSQARIVTALVQLRRARRCAAGGAA
ncbi:hypothetical protein AB0J72_20860 [Dactylosporangium sp. NPDC049742]|uniref:hypothetical protein n=1 Tax=Dactylosporangium sp. NPDC049742 TaxID=3154737 RepID=UPI00341382BC